MGDRFAQWGIGRHRDENMTSGDRQDLNKTLNEPDTSERRSNHRRSHSAWSFLYGGFRPRRRSGRRHNDKAQIFLDWHEPRFLYLALGIMLMSCTDALLTLNLLAVGAEELNVLMDGLITRDIGDFLMVKLGLTAVSVVLLVVAANRKFLGRIQVFRILEFFCAGYALLIVYELYLINLYLSDIFPSPWAAFVSIFGR